MKRELQPCGTYSAAMRHVAHGQDMCEPCRIARNEYAKQSRARNSPQAKLRRAARAAALLLLAERHAAELKELTAVQLVLMANKDL